IVDPLLPFRYTLSLHDALPIYVYVPPPVAVSCVASPVFIITLALVLTTGSGFTVTAIVALSLQIPLAPTTLYVVEPVGLASGLRSEEHTSELQSRFDLVCRLLL